MNKQLVVITSQWKTILVSFVVGVVLAFVIVASNSNEQIDRLKQYGDSVAVVAEQRKLEVDSVNARIVKTTDSLQRTQNALVTAVARNKRLDAKLGVALDSATNAADSNQVLWQQNTNLREANLTLEQALVNMTQQRDEEKIRADYNLEQFNEANRTIIKLNGQIQDLGPTLPGWVRTGAKVVVVAAAFYAGTRVNK